MFCEVCDSVMVPVRDKDAPKGAMKCLDCGHQTFTEGDAFIIKDEIKEEERSRIEVIDSQNGTDGIPEDMLEELREQYREALENFEL